MRPNLWNENWPLKREMSLCYPWTSPWWHSPAPLLLPSAPGVHFSACHWGSHCSAASRDLGLVTGQGLGSAGALLAEISIPCPGTCSWHAQLPSAARVAPPGALGSWALPWGRASLQLCLQLRSCKFREEVKEGKQNRICLESKPFDAGIA